MAMSLRCADTGADCRGEWTTDTEDEFWKHWELHVAEAHPDLVVTPELREQTKGVRSGGLRRTSVLVPGARTWLVLEAAGRVRPAAGGA
jgi:hypothetical protein